MFLNEKIKQVREALGLSQEELAHRAGVSTMTVWRLENSRIRRPHRVTLERIAVALEKPEDFFAVWMLDRPKHWYRRKDRV